MLFRSKANHGKASGGLAQLGERLHGMQEVSGSIPLFSTKKTLHSLCGVFLFARLLRE